MPSPASGTPSRRDAADDATDDVRPNVRLRMLACRIIPCLDVRNGRVVKGTRFLELQDAGDPVEQARLYNDQGADELCLLDIDASADGRGPFLDAVTAIAGQLLIPLTTGGGVRCLEDVRQLLLAGSDKVAINTAALSDPSFMTVCCEHFGSQCLVASVDAKRRPDGKGWEVYTHGGRRPTGRDALDHAVDMAERGAGELLITSMDRDGTRDGYDIELLKAVTERVSVPVIASGGVGTLAHLVEGVSQGEVQAVLAASIFHFGQHTVGDVKRALAAAGMPVRPVPTADADSDGASGMDGHVLDRLYARLLARSQAFRDRDASEVGLSEAGLSEALAARSYTAQLLRAGQGKILDKIQEETLELLQAARSEGETRICEETADLLYHVFVLLVHRGLDLAPLYRVLESRAGVSGVWEKNQRNKKKTTPQ